MDLFGTITWHDDKGWTSHDIEYEATYEVDNNHNSDADGNRGTRLAYLSALDYELPYAKMSDKDKQDIYQAIEEHALEQGDRYSL